MIAEILNAPAPLTAADAIGMCVASAVAGAALVILILIAWIKILQWSETRQAEEDRLVGRTILKRI